jgi:FkbM family methyltransferase
MDIYFGTRAQPHFERSPLTLIDIGARGGLQPNWKRAQGHLRLVGFEPDPAEYARLAAAADPRRAVYINAAVGREAAELTLNVGREGGTSSLLEPNLAFLRRFPRPERYEVVKRVPIATDRLDVLLPRNGVDDPDFIKIDTQGAELPILEGARETLAHSIVGVEVEVLFAPLYHGQSAFGDVDALLRGLGFQLFDMRHSYWKRAAGSRYGGPKGQLVFGDALYLKTEEGLAEQLGALGRRSTPKNADETLAAQRSKLLRALSVCLLYGYVDYAIEILQAQRSILEPELASEVDASLRSEIDISSRLPGFRGRGWLSHLFYRMHRALFPTFEGWASGGRHIGNVD